MPEYLAPGVFIEERAAGPAVIQGVSTSNFGSVAWTPRGTVGSAVLLTSFDEFIETFGSYWANSYIAYAMAAFFQNGGSRAYFVREVPTDAVKAGCDVESAGSSAVFIGRPLPATTDLSVNTDINLKVDAGAAADIDCSGATPAATTRQEIVDAINTAVGSDVASLYTDAGGAVHLKISSLTVGATSGLVFAAGTADASLEILGLTSFPVTIAGAAAVDRWNVEAENEGAWGNLVKMCILGDDNYVTPLTGGWSKYKVLVYEESSLGAGDYDVKEQIGPVTLTDSDASDYIETVVNDKSDRIRISEGTTPGVPRGLAPVTMTGEPVAEGAGAVGVTGYLNWPLYGIVRGSVSFTDGAENFTDNGDGTLTGDGGGSGTISYSTGQFSLTFSLAPAAGTMITAGYKRQSESGQSCCTLTSGADGTGPLARAQVSAPALAATRRGIYALDAIEDIINMALPDFAGSVPVANDLIAWAEERKDRYIILETESDLSPQEAVDFRRYTLNANTSYAALYWPWVTVSDPNSGLAKNMPPSGFVAGVYARTDQDSNVGTAPAGLNRGRLNGAIGVEYEATFGQREILNPASVNCLVDTAQTGRAVWGARSLSLDGEWLYIQVRRLFMYVEKSVFLSTHWAVFENNGPALWARVRMSLNGFLLNLHNDGYFAGTTPEDSYRIVCDASNNPQSAIDSGLMTCDVYLAPNKPGEFIRFRFQQMVKAQ